MEWWMHFAYNIDTGSRAILGVYNSPIKPSERSPFVFNGNIKTKWIKARDAVATANGARLEFTKI